MKGKYTSLVYYFEWLKSRIDKTSVITDPLRQGRENFFRKSALVRALRVLEGLGRVKLTTIDGKIEFAEVLSFDAIAAKRTNKQLRMETSEVVVVIDIDNLILRPSSLTGQIIDVEEVCLAIKKYAEKIGKVVKIEAHLTTKTRDLFSVITFCYDQGISVVIVPPRPQASDREMEKTLNLAMNCQSVKYFIIASNDSGFKGVCKKIRERGKKVHIISSANSVNGLLAAANKSISVFSLFKEMHAATHKDQEQKPPDIDNRFTLPAVRLKESAKGFEPKGADEQFVQEIFTAFKKIVPQGNSILFTGFFEKAWPRLRGGWEERGYSERDFRSALTALIRKAELIKIRKVPHYSKNGMVDELYWE